MKKLLMIIVALALVACASHDKFQDSRALVESGNVEEGLARLEQQMKDDPKDEEIRNYYLRHKQLAVENYLRAAENALGAGQLDVAQDGYQRAARLDPANGRAQLGLQRIAMARKHRPLLAEADAALKAGNKEKATENVK